MKNTMMEVPFTNELRFFLISQGYTHILNIGVDNDGDESITFKNNEYKLIPLRPNDEAFKATVKRDMIEAIDSNDIIDMAGGDPFIRFVMLLPLKEFEQYLKV